MTKRKLLQNVFSDRSSLVLRALLEDSEKKWTISELAKGGVSFGLASEVLRKAETMGYVERVLKGPLSYSRLIRKENLLNDWIRSYTFDRNLQIYYFYPEKYFLKVCVAYLEAKKIDYALTLYSASRLISSYVKDDRHFIYLNLDRDVLPSFLKKMEIGLNLYKLVQGGNVCFTIPFYGSSVFRDSREIKGYSVVSHLQLYLDLMTFPPSGPEEAKHLTTYFKKKDLPFV